MISYMSDIVQCKKLEKGGFGVGWMDAMYNIISVIHNM